MLVSVDEQRAYMGSMNLTEGERSILSLILAGVQQNLEAYLNRPVEPVQIREVAQSNSEGVLYLSVTPVWKVISCGDFAGAGETRVTVLPPVQERDPLVGEDGRLIDRYARVTNEFPIVPGGISVAPFRRYSVEYVGGYNGYGEAAIKLAIMRVAAREWATNHVRTAGQRVGLTEQTEVGDSRFLGWAGDELKSLERYRRRVVIR